MFPQDLPCEDRVRYEHRARSRFWAAALLRTASRALDKLAERLVLRERLGNDGAAASVEFYAEAGAPEGALYIDGRLVGHVAGVTRL